MNAKEHNKLLGIFFLANGGFSVFMGILMAFVYGGIGTLMATNASKEEEQFVGIIFVIVAAVIGLFILAFAGFYLLTGWKIYKEQAIGRTLGIIASCVSLMSFPIGTALGIYGLWFLLGQDGKWFYEGGDEIVAKTPPPGNWQ